METKCFFREMMKRFRDLPDAEITGVVAGRFTFGFGLGSLLASRARGNWSLVGYLTMLFGVLMALPGVVKVMRGMCH